MRHVEVKDFSLLDFIHYLAVVLVFAVVWSPVYGFWAIAGTFAVWMTLLTEVFAVMLGDKAMHWFVLPFLAKIIK